MRLLHASWPARRPNKTDPAAAPRTGQPGLKSAARPEGHRPKQSRGHWHAPAGSGPAAAPRCLAVETASAPKRALS